MYEDSQRDMEVHLLPEYCMIHELHGRIGNWIYRTRKYANGESKIFANYSPRKNRDPDPKWGKLFSEPMIEEKKKKPKRYRKNTLRKTLERKMQMYLKDPKIKVSAMEFTRWLQFYVERFNLDENICKSKTLEEPIVEAFGKWLGYPLH